MLEQNNEKYDFVLTLRYVTTTEWYNVYQRIEFLVIKYYLELNESTFRFIWIQKIGKIKKVPDSKTVNLHAYIFTYFFGITKIILFTEL